MDAHYKLTYFVGARYNVTYFLVCLLNRVLCVNEVTASSSEAV